jgi:hypothetical protein
MNRAPRNRKDKTRDSAVGATNCGRKAMKNRATFGFNKLVRSPAL